MTTFRNIKNKTKFTFIFVPGTFIKVNDEQAMGEDGKRITVNPNEEINEQRDDSSKRDRRRRN